MRSGGFVVRCPDYTTPPRKDRESAERLLEQIEADGKCIYDHEVIEVD